MQTMMTAYDKAHNFGMIHVTRRMTPDGAVDKLLFAWSGGSFLRVARDLVTLADPQHVTLDEENNQLLIGPFVTRIIEVEPDAYVVERVGIREYA